MIQEKQVILSPPSKFSRATVLPEKKTFYPNSFEARFSLDVGLLLSHTHYNKCAVREALSYMSELSEGDISLNLASNSKSCRVGWGLIFWFLFLVNNKSQSTPKKMK